MPKKETMFCEFSHCFSCFCVFAHDFRPCFQPVLLSIFMYFFIFYYKKAQHSTQHTQNTTTHTCTPATDRDLESGLSTSHTRKNPRKCLEKAESGESLARTRADTDGQIVRLRQSGERRIEPSGSWFPPEVSLVFKEKAHD